MLRARFLGSEADIGRYRDNADSMQVSAQRMDRLRQIIDAKRCEVAALHDREKELQRAASHRVDFRDFRAAITAQSETIAVIAEVKKASPSAGVICENFDSVQIAQNYASSGAQALSVLTDEKFFLGSLRDLEAVRAATSLPILRKDFVIDELQIAEAAAAGADAVLLIVAALSQDELVRFIAHAKTYHLDTLVEIHTHEELDRALNTDAQIIGINNRDLTTFAVDLAVTERLSEKVPDAITLISESGIRTAKDVMRIRACGVDAILVGESLIRGEATIASLLRQ